MKQNVDNFNDAVNADFVDTVGHCRKLLTMLKTMWRQYWWQCWRQCRRKCWWQCWRWRLWWPSLYLFSCLARRVVHFLDVCNHNQSVTQGSRQSTPEAGKDLNISCLFYLLKIHKNFFSSNIFFCIYCSWLEVSTFRGTSLKHPKLYWLLV